MQALVSVADLTIFPRSTLQNDSQIEGVVHRQYKTEATAEKVFKYYKEQIMKLSQVNEESPEVIQMTTEDQYSFYVSPDGPGITVLRKTSNGQVTYYLVGKTQISPTQKKATTPISEKMTIKLSSLEIYPGSELKKERGRERVVVREYEVIADPKEVFEYYVNQMKKITGIDETSPEYYKMIGDDRYIFSAGDSGLSIHLNYIQSQGKVSYAITGKV